MWAIAQSFLIKQVSTTAGFESTSCSRGPVSRQPFTKRFLLKTAYLASQVHLTFKPAQIFWQESKIQFPEPRLYTNSILRFAHLDNCSKRKCVRTKPKGQVQSSPQVPPPPSPRPDLPPSLLTVSQSTPLQSWSPCGEMG